MLGQAWPAIENTTAKVIGFLDELEGSMTPRSGKFDLTSEYLRQKYQIDGQYKKFKRSVTPSTNAQKVLPKTRS